MQKIYKEHLLKRGFEVDIKDKIGLGLSGQTIKGYQKSLNRPVAIKFFDNKFNKNNPDLKERFIRESKFLAELQHPSIPYAITNGSIKLIDEDIPYTIMQYIPGITLEDYIKEHAPISLESVLHISTQILDALHFAHEKNIIHRDVKPSNIMILPSGHCYLIDFSIGFKIEYSERKSRVTKTGHNLGSPSYMSPEQLVDMKNVNRRTDIYAFAIVLCELLSGKPELESLNKVEKKYPSALKKVISKGCSRDINDRYLNANDFLRELKQVSSNRLPFLDTPSKAVCNNTICPSANWSHNGYYKGAYFIEKCTDAFCTSCGNTLVYQCTNCGSAIDDKEFCGGCGTQQFSIPECKQCGSLLTKDDMDKDTEKDGCEKCIRINEQIENQKQRYQQAPIPSINIDLDDIPF